MSLAEALSADLSKLAERDLRPVEVAVLDTGIDAGHPDLADRVDGAYEILDEDGVERASALPPGDNDPFGHGTGVASIVAEIAPNARIVDVQITGRDDVETGAFLLAGLRFALLRRSPVVNLSLACHGRFLAPLTELCELAHWQDQLVVAARRNMPLLEHGIPARLSSCIGVDSDDLPSPFGFRFQPRHPIECIARGEGVTVAAPGGKYAVQTGTSFATAAVSGLCALLLGAYPELSPFEVKSALKGLAAA